MVDPVVFVAFPSPHTVHMGDPLAAENVPLRQSKQVVAILNDDCPALHALHPVDPLFAAKNPAVQFEHTAVPFADENVPPGHNVHDDEPIPENVPATHGMHTVAIAPEKLPPAHVEHGVAGFKSRSAVPALHANKLQFPNDPGGTYNPTLQFTHGVVVSLS